MESPGSGTSPLTHRHFRARLLACALLLAACSGKDAVEPPGPVASITLSPPSASIDVGQTQTLSASGKDRNGVALNGVAYTWTSSNNNVATVAAGVVTAVSPGIAQITATSRGVASNAVTLTVRANGNPGAGTSIVIDKASIFLAGTGQSAQLSAQILNAQSVPVAGTITWTSSAPGKVTVDALGRVTATAIGSAQVFAEAPGLRSPPTIAFVASPQAGAVLVTDAQVVSVGPPLGLPPGTSPGVGTTYEVTLSGVSPPAPGTVILGSETAPVAGKVISTRQASAGVVATVALAPLYELFTDYDIALRLDLSAFPAEDIPASGARTGPGAAWNARRRSGGDALSMAGNVLAPFQAFDCDASIKPQILGAPIQLSLSNALTLVLEDRPGYSKHAIDGSLTLTGSAGIKLKAGFKASGECKAQAQIKLPILGWASVLVMPAVRVGLGASIEGEILVLQGDLGVEGKVGVSGVVGWECGGATPACRGLDDVTGVNEFKSKPRLPSTNDMQVKVSGQFFVLAGLDLSLLAGAANAEILEARAGPEQSFDLAFEEDQAARRDYASSYDLKMKGEVKPGSALQKAIELVIDDDAAGVNFKAEASSNLSESPKGTLAISKALVRPDEAVDFTVDLDPATLAYFLLGYNVSGVELYRKREDEIDFTPWKSMTQVASNRATYSWVPTEADAGKYEFAAFVNTQLVTPLLEVAPGSVQPLEVSCFSAAPRLVHNAAATVCADVWTGTSTVIIKTPGQAADNITVTANITWTYDAAGSSTGIIAYKPTGSFTLKLNTSGNCTFSLSPSTFSITDDPITPTRMYIFDNGVTPAMYGMQGSQRVNFTSTATCPGKDDVVTSFNGFLAPIVSGSGPFSPNMVTLAGHLDDGAIDTTWDFRRP